ncbi:hypothetical protein M0805_002302 [Coniferiporia weirii]|nr:hypothetical protein M0805_002302 [Coniferiporia weirii]
MSSTSKRMAVDSSPGHRSSRNLSVETHRTRRSHRSRSKSRDRRSSRHEKGEHERRHRSRSHGRSDRDRSHRERDRDKAARSKSRERSHRDRDREGRDRDRDRDRRRDREDGDRHREKDRNGHRERGKDGDRDIDRDDRDRRDRRRRREDDVDDHKVKKMREDLDDVPPPPSAVLGPPDARRPRSRDSDRRSARGLRDPRDEFEDSMRPPPRRERDERNRDGKRDREDRRPSRRPPSPPDEDTLSESRRRIPSPPPPPPPPVKRPSPTYEAPSDPFMDEQKEDDSEARSVFVSQLAARMTARDLGYFFEDKLGENTVLDSRIVTDRLSRRSKGIAYVEFRSVDLVEKAIALTGTIVMGLPVMIQHTEAERNKTHAGDGSINLPPGASGHGATLYVGSLHFNLTESDIKQVFEPFGELDFVDLHKDPTTGRSKGYAFIHYKRAEDAKMALEQMEGFELAGRTLRVNTVHEKGQMKFSTQDSLEENGGGNLNAASRQALMQKLARIEPTPVVMQPISRPTIAQTMTSKSVLLRNMFDPEEESESDWDKDLGEDVKGECQSKYGQVIHIKVEKDSEGEIYVQFDSVDSAKKAVDGLHGRWFGGKQISATFISDAIMQAHR